MSAKRGTLRSLGTAISRLFGRGSRRHETNLPASVAKPDESWAAEDHQAPPQIHEEVIDPWGAHETATHSDASLNLKEDQLSSASVDSTDAEPQCPRNYLTIEFAVNLDTFTVNHGKSPHHAEETKKSSSVSISDFPSNGENITVYGGVAELEGEDVDDSLDEDLEAVLEAGEAFDADLISLDEIQTIEEETGRDAEADPGIGDVLPQFRETIVDEGWDYEAVAGQDFESFEIEAGEVEDHEHDLGLWTYDDEAYQAPWELDLSDEQIVAKTARQKAADILSRLQLDRWSERENALTYLSELLEHLRHASTFRALIRLADEVETFEALYATIELRRVWAQRPEWWCRRHRGEVYDIPKGWAALTWVLAQRICVARSDFSPDAMIEDQWLDEWMLLPPGAPGYISFPAFVAEKINTLEAEALHVGLQVTGPHESPGSSRDIFQRLKLNSSRGPSELG